MVHDLPVPGENLDCADVTRAVHRRGQNDVPEGVRAFGGQREGTWRRQHEVWRAQLPSAGEGGWRGQILAIPFRRTRALPRAEHSYIGVAEAALADEPAVTRLRRPWRHVPARRDLHDLPRMPSRIVEGQEREGARTFGVVAGRTAPIENRSDIPRKRRSGGNVRRQVPCAGPTGKGEMTPAPITAVRASAQVCDDASHGLCLAQHKRAPSRTWCMTAFRSLVRCGGPHAARSLISVVDAPAVYQLRRSVLSDEHRGFRGNRRAGGSARSCRGSRNARPLYANRCRCSRMSLALSAGSTNTIQNSIDAAAACRCRRSSSGAYRFDMGQSDRVNTNTTALPHPALTQAAAPPGRRGRTR